MKRLSLFHSRRNREKSHGAASRSQALLEFALAVPILLMLLFGIIDLAALFSAWLSVENIARQTVRYAVTGQYDPTFCVDGPDVGADACAGDDWEAEQDAARLLSVQEYANRRMVALFHTPGAAQDEIGHVNITVCSTRDADDDGSPDFTFYAPTVPTYGDCQQGGVSTSDAGAPGDRVIIAVDYNHPYITPIFNQTWPMTHLFSQREGIVEQFRVPRLISLPPLIGGPTLTPSNTPPPTATGTATASPTATNTPLPLYIEIINPEVSGVIITSVDQTRFEAVAWDPNIGTANGTGIDRIDFWFTGPSHIPGRTERQIGYCAFSGNAPCQRIDAVVDYTTLANGTYTMYARARGSDGRYSEIVSKEFILQFPATATATITNTPTATAVPSCDDLSIVNTYISDDDFRVTIRNSSTAEGYLVGSTMTWNSPYSPPVYFDYFWFRNTYSANQYYNPSSQTMYSTTNPVISWSDPAGAPSPLAGDAKTIWGADFSLQDKPMAGNYSVTLTFYLPDVGNCVLSTSIVQATPTPSPTPYCHVGGSIFTTDLNGDPQNAQGYDCPFGCVLSPYLSSNNLPPGNYSWTVETVSNPKVQVNDGTFTLNPGQQAGPPSGVIVPLGWTMYNIPPGYFPGVFKVHVFQTNDPSCNAKSDTFKINHPAPTPEPTNTPHPTNTPRPTNTPTNTPIATPTPTICFDC